MLNTVERVTPPSRVNASLERYSTGCDLDKRIVLKDGRVIKERGGTRQQNLADAY